MRILLRISILAALLPVAACDTFLGESEDAPLPGDRIAVLQRADAIAPDPSLAGAPLDLPEPAALDAWPQAGGTPSHTVGHVALDGGPARAWTASLGAGSDDEHQLLASPVVAEGRVYAMDAVGTVSALDLGSGRRIWQVELAPEDEDDGYFGGGLAFDGGKVFVATGFARVYALDAATGATAWEHRVSAPVRAAPTVTEGRVFVITLDNQLFALSADDGRELWTHSGIAEAAGVVGGASPAVAGNIVVAPFSSGEIFAIRVENGRVVWSDSLSTIERSNALTALSDISGRPVIDRDLVIATSHGGRTLAIDLRRGVRAWELDAGGTADPWVAGSVVFLVTADARLVAVSRNDGRVYWVQQLPRYRDEEEKEDPIAWAGPVLAGGRLYIAGSNGQLLAVQPADGAVAATIDLPGGARLAPVVAGGTLLLATEAGSLVAYR